MELTEADTNQYALAGWLAIVSAVMLMPEIALAALSENRFPALNIFVIPIHVANLVIGVYILYLFRRLLNRQFAFHATDLLITLLIAANVIFFLIGLIELFVNMIGFGWVVERSLSLITIILFVPFSLLTIVFGVMLLRMKDDLFGLLKPYAYMTIGSGVCGATVILMPFGLFAAAAALIVTGMIFLRVKKEAEIL